jgi:excisionase family DNA binding protein
MGRLSWGNERKAGRTVTPLMTIKDVSQFLSVSVITVRRLVATGELACIRLTKGGPMRFDLRDVEKFVAEHRQ